MSDRETFIETHYHELLGIVLDAAIGDRKGSELSLWIKAISHQIRLRLAAIYDQMTQKENTTPKTNETHGNNPNHRTINRSRPETRASILGE